MSTLFLLVPEAVYRDVTVILIGSLVHWMLYGVLLVQICLYYTAFPNDHRALKLVVLLQLVFETIQTTTLTHDLFRIFTLGFEDVSQANEADTMWFSVPLMTGLIATLAQMFYCYRTAVFTRSKYAVALIAVLAITQPGSATAVAIQVRDGALISNVLDTEISLITVGIWGASGVGCDVTIAAIMVYYLQKKDTGFQATHNIINRLIRLTIETGLVTASVAVIAMALVYIPGHPPYYQIAILILAKVYSNSMVAALNSRMKVVSNSSGLSPSWNESESLAMPMDWAARASVSSESLHFSVFVSLVYTE